MEHQEKPAADTKTPQLPAAIASAAVCLLRPYCPGLTAERLSAVVLYQPETQREPLMTRGEVARALAVSLPTIDRMLRSGDLPRRCIRGAVRVPAGAVDRLVSSGAAS